MDSKSFIIHLLDIAIWPVTIFILIMMFRKYLVELIPLLKKLKYKDLELDFGQKMQKLKKDAEDSFTNNSEEKYTKEKEHLHSLSEISPCAAIMESWKEVEVSTLKLIMKHKPDVKIDSSTPYRHMQTIFEKDKLIEMKMIKVFGDLRTIRNRAAHAINYEINTEKAVEYVDVALKLKAYLEKGSTE